MRKKAEALPHDAPLEMIADRAYLKFVARGGEHGHDLEDWFAAEEELRAELAPSRPRSRITRRPRLIAVE